MAETYTAFCQHVSGRGTIWIDKVEGDDINDACERAAEACAADWECDPDTVHVLGLAKGDCEIVIWEDIGND
jgi:hypothetical protein